MLIATVLGIPALALGQIGDFLVGGVRLVRRVCDSEDVDPDDGLRVSLRQPSADARAEVTAVSEIAVESEARHEPVPQLVGGDAWHGRLLRRGGKAGQ